MAEHTWLPADGRTDGRASLYRGHIIWVNRDGEREGWWYGVWRLGNVQEGFLENGSALRAAGPFESEDGPTGMRSAASRRSRPGMPQCGDWGGS